MLEGCGWKPYFVEGDDPMTMHKKMAETMDTVIEEIKAIQKHARDEQDPERPKWPMIILRTPKGWTGPKFVDGQQIEGSSAPIRFRSAWRSRSIYSFWKTG